MNRKNIVSIVTLLFIGGFMLTVLFGCNKDYDFTKMIHFNFEYSLSTANGDSKEYDITYSNEQYIVQIKPIGVVDTYDTFIVDDDFMQELITILSTYHVETWNGFHKSNHHVLDGNHFHLLIENDTNDFIEASGYQKWPKNYTEVRNELDNLFNSLYTQK